MMAKMEVMVINGNINAGGSCGNLDVRRGPRGSNGSSRDTRCNSRGDKDCTDLKELQALIVIKHQLAAALIESMLVMSEGWWN